MRSLRVLLVVTFLPLIGAVACSSSGDTSSTTSGGGGSEACPQNGTVPADLRDVERAGEGLVSTTFGAFPARAPDWQNAATVLGILKKVWTKTTAACPTLPAANVMRVDAAIATLDTAVAKKDQKSAAFAANEVGLAVPVLFDYFHPDAPIEVVRMDAVFRQVGLDAHFGDWTAAAADVKSLESDWANAKATVASKAPMCHRVGGTATVATDIEASFMNLDAAVPKMDATATETESESGALEIDTLELLFDCPPDGPPPAHGLGSKCKATADCGAGFVCDTANAGGTCAPDPATASIGGACTTTVDCGTDSRSACLTEAGDGYPGGYCGMEPCDDVQVCPPGGTCVSQPHETPGCYQACKADGDCRTSEGYVCQTYPTTPPLGFGPSNTACGFACKDDAGCTSPFTCNKMTGKCQP